MSHGTDSIVTPNDTGRIKIPNDHPLSGILEIGTFPKYVLVQNMVLDLVGRGKGDENISTVSSTDTR
jgi:hypothetical protein